MGTISFTQRHALLAMVAAPAVALMASDYVPPIVKVGVVATVALSHFVHGCCFRNPNCQILMRRLVLAIEQNNAAHFQRILNQITDAELEKYSNRIITALADKAPLDRLFIDAMVERLPASLFFARWFNRFVFELLIEKAPLADQVSVAERIYNKIPQRPVGEMDMPEQILRVHRAIVRKDIADLEKNIVGLPPKYLRPDLLKQLRLHGIISTDTALAILDAVEAEDMESMETLIALVPQHEQKDFWPILIAKLDLEGWYMAQRLLGGETLTREELKKANRALEGELALAEQHNRTLWC